MHMPVAGAMARRRPSLLQRRWVQLAVIVVCAYVWSVSTTSTQLRSIARNTPDLPGAVLASQSVVVGDAGRPEQYRLLTPFLLHWFTRGLAALGFPDTPAFIRFRAVQDILAFCLVALYVQRLGYGFFGGLVGMSLLGWAYTQNQWSATFGLSLYSEVVFCLGAVIALAASRPGWAFVLTIAAAANRETAVMIPVMMLAASYAEPLAERRRAVRAWAGAALLAYVVVGVSIRVAVGPRPLALPGAPAAGLPALLWNLRSGLTWNQVFGVWNLVPLIALAAWAQWPPLLRCFCWALLPLGGLVYFGWQSAPHAAQLFVPFAVLFIPGALAAATHRPAARSGDTAS